MKKLLIYLMLSFVYIGCFNQDSKVYVATYRQREVININSASMDELDLLPNVGKVKAKRIIDSRKEKAFDSISDFHSRHLVGDTVFNEIKEDIYVGARTD